MHPYQTNPGLIPENTLFLLRQQSLQSWILPEGRSGGPRRRVAGSSGSVWWRWGARLHGVTKIIVGDYSWLWFNKDNEAVIVWNDARLQRRGASCQKPVEGFTGVKHQPSLQQTYTVHKTLPSQKTLLRHLKRVRWAGFFFFWGGGELINK